MIWSDSGYLLSKNKFGENSVIAEFYTENHGKISGLIYGATSKKIKNYLQIGNKFHINYNSKNENKLGYLNVEIIKERIENLKDPLGRDKEYKKLENLNILPKEILDNHAFYKKWFC